MEGGQATGVMWYNYNPVDGLITANTTPVQVELGTVDIARQINQQVQLQYGSLQAVPAQAQQIIVTQQPTLHQPSPPTPDTPEPPSTPKSAKPRSRPTNGERVPCSECGKTFSCNANLRDHMRLHTGERPFMCTECGMSFAQRSNWRLHKRVHTGERPYMCGICGKTFARSSHLPGHMRVHTGERPYSCEECDNSFASAQALKNHARTHTGEKPFVCEFCSTAFTHSSSLSSHKKRCTGEKRKRGRPLGSGRKSYRKKSTGRPRGRPRKKGRYTKKGRRKTTPAEGEPSIELKEEVMMGGEVGISEALIKAEIHSEMSMVQAKQELIDEVPTVVVDVTGVPIDNPDDEPLLITSDPLDHTEETQQLISGTVVTGTEVVTEDLGDTSDLHQEAAVAMAALHEGAALNLAHHQLPQETYVDRENTQQTLWFPKQY